MGMCRMIKNIKVCIYLLHFAPGLYFLHLEDSYTSRELLIHIFPDQYILNTKNDLKHLGEKKKSI